MSRMATTARAPGPYTRADLEGTPDDGRRYELVDGHFHVSAAPGTRHQDAVAELLILLRTTSPKEFKVLPAPYAVALTGDTELQPDIVVGRREDFTEWEIRTPLLAIEVLSPSTRMFDTHVKRERLERAGIVSYWVVDPVARPAEASLVAWELGPDGLYQQVAKVVGHERFAARLPFAVTVVPADLVI
jgi:Uma2 family endonuclease